MSEGTDNVCDDAKMDMIKKKIIQDYEAGHVYSSLDHEYTNYERALRDKVAARIFVNLYHELSNSERSAEVAFNEAEVFINELKRRSQ